MRYRKNMGRRVVVTLLATVLACGNVPMQVAWGLESVQQQEALTTAAATAQVSDVSVQSDEGEGTAVADAAMDETEQDGDAAATGSASDATNAATPQASENADAQQPAVTGDDEGTDASEPDPAAETQPYSIDVTFDGQTLAEGEGNNNLADVWTTGSKIVNVKLARNKSVTVDSGKQYVLCMSVPDMLFFNGVPDASKINGVEQTAMVQNAKPAVQSKVSGYAGGSYPLSAYSGEIRFKLNTSVDVVEITDLGINFDPVLLGFSASTHGITDALSVRVEEVDSSANLDEYTDSSTLAKRTLDSVQVQRTDSKATAMKLVLSNDGFVASSVNVDNVNTGKDGSATYAVSTSGSSMQFFKELQIEFDCPYIEVPSEDGSGTERHYLDFSMDDSALQVENKKGVYRGYAMANAAVYDSERHVITFTFKDLVIGNHTVLMYSPTFIWPQELADQSVPAEGYRIKGASWRVSNQVCYSDEASNLFKTSTFSASNYISFVSDMVNIAMVSSDEADPSKKIAKRRIYEGITRANKRSGTLGFFDVHNDGAVDSQNLDIKFEFNTNPSAGATYYVTSVRLPAGATTVNYEVTNGAETRSGSKVFNNNATFSCSVTNLGYDSSWYIKSLSYQNVLKAGIAYHQETAHLYRNRSIDGGLFFGFIEGEVGAQAEATMTISSVDGESITLDGQNSITSTERSTIASDDFSAYQLQALGIDGASSTAITAGQTSRLKFGAIVSDEEYTGSSDTSSPLYGYVNGYHVMRNPVAYVCLPEGVSIAGAEQAAAAIGNSDYQYQAKSVTKLDDVPVVVDGVTAYWWEIDFGELDVPAGRALSAQIMLSTDLKMSGLVWDFSSCVAWRSKGQAVSWTAASSLASGAWNNASSLASSSRVADSMKVLGTILNGQEGTNDGKLGLVFYAYNSNVRLNIARAEAKLDVDTELSTGSTVSKDLRVTDAGSTVNYQVDVSSTDGGSAENFNYYIPVPKQSAALDNGSFVSQMDYDLQLKNAVNIEDLSGSNSNNPFEVLYTTKTGLDSTSVAELPDGTDDPSVGWVEEADLNGNYGAVTAVLIRTKARAEVANGAQYRFNLTLGYDSDASGDFASQAGRVVKWRSFGHYTYTRNDAETTNTYPSQDNSVRLGYVSDLTSSPIDVNMATDADDNLASFGLDLNQSFLNDQTLTVKSVTVSGGTSLVTSDPASLTGSDANSKFRMALGVRGADNILLTNGYQGGNFDLAAGDSLVVNGGVRFSRALTDTTTNRYVDVVLGNDDINVKVRIKLNRTVKAASVAGSGTAVGEQFKAASVSEDAKTIAANSAFTALFDVDGFVPGNFTAQKLTWKRGGVATALPSGATVTMLVLGDSDAVDSMWLWRANGSSSSVDLSQFTRMAGSGSFSYDKASTTATRLKYQFVVSLPQGGAASGDYSLSFEATPVSGATAVSVELPVTLAGASGFSLSADGGKVTYSYSESGGDDVRTTGKQLALVLTPAEGTNLPADARISANGTEYVRNASGYYIVPLGTVESGSVELSLVSSMADAKGGSYTFDAKLMLAGSDVSPMAGSQVGDTSVTLGIAASASPSIKVTGTRVAHKSDWSGGEDFAFEVRGVPDGGSVTVSAFNGLTYTTPATNLMSSVGGVFAIEGGTGTYTGSGGVSTGKLVLSSAASAGTYRLVFEVKDAGGTVLASTTYYVIVRE